MPSDWTKSPPELVALWEEVVPTAPGVVRKPMFGYPAAFTNGNMFAGLHAKNLVLRLPEETLHAEFAGLGGKPFEPMAGRPMRGYLTAPEAILADKQALSGWLARSFEAVARMPAKEKKAPKKKPSP